MCAFCKKDKKVRDLLKRIKVYIVSKQSKNFTLKRITSPNTKLMSDDAKVEYFFETAKYFYKILINLSCTLLYSIFIVCL